MRYKSCKVNNSRVSLFFIKIVNKNAIFSNFRGQVGEIRRKGADNRVQDVRAQICKSAICANIFVLTRLKHNRART